MAIYFRKPIRIGPFTWHFTQSGYSSWSFKLGPFSWNSKTRATRVDLPGPLSYRTPPRPRKRKKPRSTTATAGRR